MPKVHKKNKLNTVLSVTFPEDVEYYNARDLANFLQEITRLYLEVIRVLRDNSIDFKQSHMYSGKTNKYLVETIELVESQLVKRYPEWLKQQAIHFQNYENYDEMVSMLNQALESRFSLSASYPPYEGIASDNLKIVSIDYNSPLKLGLNGYLLPLVITFVVCGGKITGPGISMETEGLAETAIKIKKEYFSSMNVTQVDIYEELKETKLNDKVLSQIRHQMESHNISFFIRKGRIVDDRLRYALREGLITDGTLITLICSKLVSEELLQTLNREGLISDDFLLRRKSGDLGNDA